MPTTGAPIPDALIERLREARRFNQGFETVEYAACALVDMALHALEDPEGVDVAAFEAAELARIGMPREIVMRHRLPHFDHLFAGSWYAAGYYVYLWAEVLDADAYEAFVEAGDVFDRRARGATQAPRLRRRAAPSTRRPPTARSAVATRPSSRCSSTAGWSAKRRRPDDERHAGRLALLRRARSSTRW